MGLTESEAKVYFHLLKKKNFTATEISKLSNVSRRKVYEVLAKLTHKGLCTETFGRVRKYSAVNPKVGFDNLIKGFEEKKKIGLNLSKALFPLYLSEKENVDPLDYIHVMRDKSLIVGKYYSLKKDVKIELLSFTKGPYACKIGFNNEDYNPLARGVKCKAIYEIDDMRKEHFLKMIQMFEKAGEEIRIAHELPLKLTVFDEKIVLCALKDRITSRQNLTSLIIEHSDFAKAFKRLFEGYWHEAMTFEEFKTKEKL